RYGISIGHHDTDNVVRDNDVRASGEVGILFRKERIAAFQGNRNRIQNNRIAGIVQDRGVGIDVRGETKAIHIVGNEIRETGGPAQRIGVRIAAEAADIRLEGNRIDGFSQSVLDLRT
ncbi:MAG TPA: right-handed parallel beta-helix repeat-containing protein, partial [Bryobacteraceae bacterium]|nr:right-handed parallel beta-helix repeat-containing protein [Bryobacteraceae bacterium]